jgi:hypothetical protein
MFSSFFKSIRSIAKGPRAVLAESIAKVLSEHFVLDPGDVESSLLRDTKIVLKNTQLRQRKYRSDVVPNTVVSVKGVVEEVVFSWRWSLTGEASTTGTAGQSSYESMGGIVQDVVLAIRGIKVQITLDAWDQMDEADQVLVESLESASIDGDSEGHVSVDDGTSAEEKEGYIKQYVRQVVDHLVLKLEDFEFAIQVGNGPSIIMSGKDLELGTLSSTNANKDTQGSTTIAKILSQRISLGSISISGRDNPSGDTFLLIEPFGYAAAVTRLSGERFRGGLLSGLEVIGQPEARDASANGARSDIGEGVVLHIGLAQIRVLSAIGMMLVPSNSRGAETSGSNDSRDEVNETKETEDEVQCTTLNLPLPGLTIVLSPSEANHNPTRLTFPRTTVLYTTDGKVFQMESFKGIKDNGTPLIELVPGGKWSIDFVKKLFYLDKNGGGCKMRISEDSLKRISSGIASLSSVEDVSNLKDTYERTKEISVDRTNDIGSESWSIITASLSLHLNAGHQKWMEANIAHCSATLSPEMDKFTEIGMGNCIVTTSFNNASAITVPPCRYSSGMLQIPNDVEIRVGSMENAYDIRDFALSFLQPFEKSGQHEPKDTPHPSNGNSPLPCAVELDRLKLFLGELFIDIESISGIGNSLGCRALTFNEPSGIAASLVGIESDFDTDMQMKIDRVSTFVIPGVMKLDSPVVDAFVRYSKKCMFVDVPNPLHASMLSSSKQNDPSNQRNDIGIPFHIKFRVADVNLKTLSGEDKSCVQMTQIAANVSPKVVSTTYDRKGNTGAQISLEVESIKHQLFQAQKTYLSFA